MTNIEGDKGGSKVDRKKVKEEKQQTKVVVRHLPPSMTLESFLEQVDIPPHDYIAYAPPDKTLLPHCTSQVYINFLDVEDLMIFTQKFDGYVFLDSKGHEYQAIVEFALFQQIAKPKTNNPNKKKNTKCATIEEDPYFVQFKENLMEEREKAGARTFKQHYFETNTENEEKSKITDTPLLQYLRTKTAEKAKSREEKKEERKKRETERKKAREEQAVVRRAQAQAKKSAEQQEQQSNVVYTGGPYGNKRDAFTTRRKQEQDRDRNKPGRDKDTKNSDTSKSKTSSKPSGGIQSEKSAKPQQDSSNKDEKKNAQLKKEDSTTNSTPVQSETTPFQDPAIIEMRMSGNQKPSNRYTRDNRQSYNGAADKRQRNRDEQRNREDGKKSNNADSRQQGDSRQYGESKQHGESKQYGDSKNSRNKDRPNGGEVRKDRGDRDGRNRDRGDRYSRNKQDRPDSDKSKPVDNKTSYDKTSSKTNESKTHETGIKANKSESPKSTSKTSPNKTRRNGENSRYGNEKHDSDNKFHNKTNVDNSNRNNNKVDLNKSSEKTSTSQKNSIDNNKGHEKTQHKSIDSKSNEKSSKDTKTPDKPSSTSRTNATANEKTSHIRTIDKTDAKNSKGDAKDSKGDAKTKSDKDKTSHSDKTDKLSPSNETGARLELSHKVLQRRKSLEGKKKEKYVESGRRNSLDSGEGVNKTSGEDGRDPRTERRIRNKDRPSIAIYRPGMGRFSKQRIGKDKSGGSLDQDSHSHSPSPTNMSKTGS
uniref:Regulator of nonsense transcripts 3A n=1 Tax=Cacopsylla melanoneura TaxID=428564 RepID=A0A8D8SAL0_9HEMI